MRHRWLSVLSAMPLRLHYCIADVVLFPLLYHVIRYRRKVVARNISNAFPDATAKERRRIIRLFYRQFASLIGETIYGYGMSGQEMEERVVYANTDAVKQMMRTYGGCIALLSHFGTWEWLADLGRRIEAEGMSSCVVYRRLKNAYFDRLMLDIRAKRGGVCVEKDVLLRHMVRLRSEGQQIVYGMLADQRPSPRNAHVWTPFLHQETAFLNGSEVLGQRFGYPCVYSHIELVKRGYYHVTFIPLQADPALQEVNDAIAAQPEDVQQIIYSEQSITEKYARLLERNILAQPHLWLWTHNRWKYAKPKD